MRAHYNHRAVGFVVAGGMQFAADQHVELLRAMSRVGDHAVVQGCAERPSETLELAFLPNLMPMSITQHEGKNVHMFSLVHQGPPDIKHQWRLMLRGLDLEPLLCDKTSIQILELLGQAGGVDWKDLPGSQKRGSVGIYFHVPNETTALRIKNLAEEIKGEGGGDLAEALAGLSVAASAEEDRDHAQEGAEAEPVEVLVDQIIE